MSVESRVATRSGMRQVAAAAGVSVSTVSNVLNNPDRVATDTRRRVEDAMDRVGFVRNRAARQLRGMPSAVVGCVLLDSANLFFAETARGIEDRLAEAGCMLVVCSTDVRAERERDYLRMLEEHGVRGILVSPVSTRLDELTRLGQRGTPVVLLDHPQAGLDLCAASVDNVRGGQLAVEHLLSLGHRRIADVRAAFDVRSLADRGRGAVDGVVAAGLDPAEVLTTVRVAAPTSDRSVAEAVDRVLALDPRPTAVLCFNDDTALRVVRALHQRGIGVPDGMSVIGYDDVRFAAELAPPLTTIRQPTYRLGRAAAELLLAEADGGHLHQEVLFRPELIVRGSTRPV